MAGMVRNHARTKIEPYTISFLSFPSEIRNEIYKNLATSLPLQGKPAEGHFEVGPYSYPSSMLLVNQQIREEFLHAIGSYTPGLPFCLRLCETPAKRARKAWLLHRAFYPPPLQLLLPYVRGLGIHCEMSPRMAFFEPQTLLVEAIQDKLKIARCIRPGQLYIGFKLQFPVSLYWIACQVAPLLENQAVSELSVDMWRGPAHFLSSWAFERVGKSTQWNLRHDRGAEYSLSRFECLKVRDGKPVEDLQDMVYDKSDGVSVKNWCLLRNNDIPLGCAISKSSVTLSTEPNFYDSLSEDDNLSGWDWDWDNMDHFTGGETENDSDEGDSEEGDSQEKV